MCKRLSGSVLLAVALAGVAAAATGAQPGLAASEQTWRAQLATDPTGAVGLAASTLLWLLIGLVAVGVVATVLGRLPGALGRFCDAVSQRLLPAAMRRALHLMIGVSIGVTALAPTGAWAANVAFVRPSVAVMPADSLPNPLPSLGEPGGPVTMPTATTPLPQVAPTPSIPVGTPGTPAPTAVAPSSTTAPASDAPSPAPSAAAPSPSAPAQTAPTQTAPNQTASTQTAPTQTAPTQTAPAQTAPNHSASALPSTAAGPAGATPPTSPVTPPAGSLAAPELPVRQAVSAPKAPRAVAARWPGIDTTMAGALGRPTGGATTSGANPPAGTSGDSADTRAVSVVPGDSLWVLAARDLARRDGGTAPSDAAIATEWPRWWAANRIAIGVDPNLLTPGQHLTPPA